MTALPPNIAAQAFVDDYAKKPLLRLAVVGSVDDGKSTLIGRLLYETGSLHDDHVRAVKKASGSGELDFSLFTDGLKAEREQGITIDVAYRYFTSSKRKIIIADTPGHTQYTRNMATGASTADAAIILVDARLGVLPQTVRHASIASLLGIRSLAVAINKMDLVQFDREIFTKLSDQVRALVRTLGFEQLQCFPVSAALGDNITVLSQHTPWHIEGTLLEWLEAVPHHDALARAPFRLAVQGVLRPNLDYRGFIGQIASGSVRVGDPVVVLPSGLTSPVRAIDTFDGPLDSAAAPRAVTLRLADEIDVSRGDVIAHPAHAPRVLHRLEAELVWFSETPLAPGQRFVIKQGSRQVSAMVDEVRWRKNLEDLSQEPASRLNANDIGRVHLSLLKPLVADAYTANRRLGAFIVIHPQTHDTVAAGMVVDGEGASEPSQLEVVSKAERWGRLGQTGALVLTTEALAPGLERALFDAGLITTSARDTELAIALAQAGLVVVVGARAQVAQALSERAGELGVRTIHATAERFSSGAIAAELRRPS